MKRNPEKTLEKIYAILSSHIKKMTPEERFWKKVNMSANCWDWVGTINKDGYGYGIPTALFKKFNTDRAHRVAWMLYGFHIPHGMFIDHICRNRKCVKPAHLRVVTPRENALENNNCAGALNKNKNSCVRGHMFSGKNLYVRTVGGKTRRYCKECRETYALRKRK